MLERWINRKKIPAIHERDIESIIRDLGLYDKIAMGEVNCSICGEKIRMDNILGIYMEEEEIILCCDKGQCCEVVLGKRDRIDNE